jgi:hypothetical protein
VVWSNLDLGGQSSPHIYNYGLWDARTNNTFSGNYNSSGITVFNNYGTFRKSGGSAFASTYLDSSTLFNNPGTVDVETGQVAMGGGCTLAGGTLNFGISNSNNFGSIYLGSSTVLTGELSVDLNGYSPVASNSFALVNYGSETGTFASFNLPNPGPGLVWQTNYGPGAFTLSVTVSPPQLLPNPVASNGSNQSFSFSWVTVPGKSYQVQYSTNLMPANWINLGNPITATNGVTTLSDPFGSNSRRFYRVSW